jgi:hypothetical protein
VLCGEGVAVELGVGDWAAVVTVKVAEAESPVAESIAVTVCGLALAAAGTEVGSVAWQPGALDMVADPTAPRSHVYVTVSPPGQSPVKVAVNGVPAGPVEGERLSEADWASAGAANIATSATTAAAITNADTALAFNLRTPPAMPYALVTDPADRGHIYAGLCNGQVWESADQGDHWATLDLDLVRVHRVLVAF